MSAIFAPGSSGFAQCHASTIAALPGGRLVAAWFAGTAEKNPDTAIWGSIFDGTAWCAPACWFKLGNQAHWNPVLFAGPDGLLHLWFKTGADCETWRTWRSVSRDGGQSWAPAEAFLGQDALARGPTRCQPIVTASGAWLAPSSSERVLDCDGRIWWPFIDRSDDGGRTWAVAPIRLAAGTPAGKGAIQPTLWTSHGGVHCLLRTNLGEIYRSDSADDGRTWCPAYSIGQPNNNAGIAVASLPDGRLLMLWNPVGKDWGPRTPLRLSVSQDDGRSWTTVQDLATGDGEFSYPALVVADGLVTATWTDKRTTIGFWQGRL